MFVLVLNASNVDTSSNTDNNTLVYNFPNSVVLKDKYI